MNLQEELKKITAQYAQPPERALSDAFPIGLPVRDKDGRTGVVVGYTEGKVVVEATIAEEGQEPILRQTPIASEYIAPVYPRPSRYELLAAVEEAILRVARDRPVPGTVESQARAVLTLAQARALL